MTFSVFPVRTELFSYCSLDLGELHVSLWPVERHVNDGVQFVQLLQSSPRLLELMEIYLVNGSLPNQPGLPNLSWVSQRSYNNSSNQIHRQSFVVNEGVLGETTEYFPESPSPRMRDR